MSGSWSSARSERGMGTWDLAKDATLRIRPGRGGVVLRADRGCLILTQPGDPEDHVLQAGEEVRLPRGGDVVAWALEEARLVVAAALPAARARSLPHGPALAGP
ncbi:MAG TPA: DUF2917 domain-containing protein [Anaeromyxobacteraceae bacterium]